MCIIRMQRAREFESTMKKTLSKQTQGAKKALISIRDKIPQLPVTHLKIAGERVKLLGDDDSDEILLDRDYLGFLNDDVTREKARNLLMQIFSKNRPVRIFGCDSGSSTLVKRALLYRYNKISDLTRNELAARGDDVSVRGKIHHLNELKKLIDSVDLYCSSLGAPALVREVSVGDAFTLDDEEKIKTLIRKFARLIILSATSKTEKQESLGIIKAIDAKKDFSSSEIRGLQAIDLDNFSIVDALTALGVHGKFGVIKKLFESIVAAIQESPIYEESSEFKARFDAIVASSDMEPTQKVNEVIGLLLKKYKETRDLMIRANEQARELQKALEEKIAAVKRASDELQVATERLSKIEGTHEEEKRQLESGLAEAKANFETAKRDHERAQKEIEELESQLQDINVEGSSAKAGLAQMKTLTETLQATVNRLQNENTAQGARISELEQQLAANEEKLAATTKEKDAASIELAAASEKVKQYESTATITQKGMAEKAAALTASVAALAAVNQKFTELARQHDTLTAERDRIRGELLRMTESVSSLTLEVKKGQEKQAEMQTTVTELQESVKGKDAQIKTLQERLEEETARLRKEALAEIEKQKGETSKALESITVLQGQLGEKNQTIQKMTDDYEKKISSITAEFSQKVEAEKQKASATLSALQTQQEAEISKLKADSLLVEKRFIAEKDAIIQQMQKDLSEGAREQMAAAIERARAEATGKLAALQKLFDEQKVLLTKAQEEKRAAEVAAAAGLQAKMKEMTAERESSIAKIKEEKEAECAQKILETKQAHEKELAVLRSSGATAKEEAIGDLEDKYAADIARIEKEADTKRLDSIDRVRREYERMFSVVRDSHKAKLEELAQQRSQSVADALEKQRASLEATFQKQLVESLQRKDAELTAQKKGAERTIGDLKYIRDTLHSQLQTKDSETAGRIKDLTAQVAAKESERVAAIAAQSRERTGQAKKIQQFAARVLAGQLNSTPYPGEENKPLRNILEKIGEIQKTPSISKEICTLVLFVNYYINTIFRSNVLLGQRVYETISAAVLASVGRLKNEGKIKSSDDSLRDGLFYLIGIFDDILFSVEKLITSYGTDVENTGIYLHKKETGDLDDFQIIWNLLRVLNINPKDCYDLMKRRTFGTSFTDIPIYPPMDTDSPLFSSNVIIVYEPNSATVGKPYTQTNDIWKRLLRLKRFENGFLPANFSSIQSADIPSLASLTANRPVTYEVLFLCFLVACQMYVSRLDLTNANCYLPDEVRNPMSGFSAVVPAPQPALPPVVTNPPQAQVQPQAQAQVQPPRVPMAEPKKCVMMNQVKLADQADKEDFIYFTPTSTQINIFRNYPYCLNVEKRKKYDLQSVWSYINTLHSQAEFRKLPAPPGFAKDTGTGKITLLDKYSKKIVIGGRQTMKQRKDKSSKKTRKLK